MAIKLLRSLAVASLVSGCVDAPDLLEGTTESAVTVAPGSTYQIVNQGGECIDVPSYSRSSATHLQGSACKRSGYVANQHFTFDSAAGGRIRGFDSQLCLDLPSSATGDGTYVQQSQCNGGQNQLWNVINDGNGYVTLTTALDGTKCVYLDGTHQLRLARCSLLTATAKHFAMAPVRTYDSIRANTGQCLDLPSATTATGASPQLFGCKTSDTTNQEWALEPVASGTFRLRGQGSGKCLDLRAGSLVDSTVIEQVPCTGAAAQQWRLAQQTTSQWKLQNVASSKCADFYAGALRQYTCSTSFPSQLFTFEPGLSGPPLGLITPPAPLVPNSGPQPSYGVDPALSPINLHTTALDNAAVLEWTDANPSTRQYLVLLWESIPGVAAGTAHEEIVVPVTDHSFWFGRIGGRPLVPGRHYTIEVWAMGPHGVSPSTTACRVNFDLPSATIRIGTQLNGTQIAPTPIGVFSVFDFNGNGIVDGAPAGNGTFPRFPSASGGRPISAVGNGFATAGGVRANAIVGYLLQEANGRQTFVAYHFLIDPMTNASRSIAVFYGDLDGSPGTNVWSSTSATVGSVEVTSATHSNTPNIVNGHITAPAMANDGSMRVIDFDFVTALDPG